MERWRKIAEGASKQCGRLDIPRVGQINNFDMAIKNSDQEGIKLIAALNDKAIPLKKALSDVKGTNIVVAIGPEGDFTEDEIRLARQERFALVDLGPRVLRSDTAALAVLAILNYELTG
jgi:16S rRNA (uracil1498-N3)-methyltransferase